MIVLGQLAKGADLSYLSVSYTYILTKFLPNSKNRHYPGLGGRSGFFGQKMILQISPPCLVIILENNTGGAC
jgi:hypothetical protein